jgi:transposase
MREMAKVRGLSVATYLSQIVDVDLVEYRRKQFCQAAKPSFGVSAPIIVEASAHRQKISAASAQRILFLLAADVTAQQIAVRLNISVSSVRRIQETFEQSRIRTEVPRATGTRGSAISI